MDEGRSKQGQDPRAMGPSSSAPALRLRDLRGAAAAGIEDQLRRDAAPNAEPLLGRDELLSAAEARLAEVRAARAALREETWGVEGAPVEPSGGADASARGRSVLTLHGPRGVGATAVARALAQRLRQDYEGGVFLVDASLANGVLPPLDLVALATERELPGLDRHVDPCCRAHLALRDLGRKRSLLILDGAPGWEDVRSWLPPLEGSCDVLVTSLDSDWPADWNPLPVAPLEAEAVRAFVLERWPACADADQRTLIAAADGSLPVAAALACAGRALEGSGAPLGQFLRDLGTASGAETAAATLAFAALDHVDGRAAGADARLILHALFAAADRRLALPVLEEWVAGGLGWDAARFDAAFERCVEAELVETAGRLRFGGQLSAALGGARVPWRERAPLRRVRRRQYAALTADLARVSKGWRDLDGVARFARIASWGSTWAMPTKGLGSESTLEELRDVTDALFVLSFDREAFRWASTGLTRLEGACRRFPHLASDLEQVRGRVLRGVGERNEAMAAFRAAAGLATDGLREGEALHEVGMTLASTGGYGEALGLLERAFVSKGRGDERGRVDHRSLASTSYALGWCLDGESRYEEARVHYRRAIDLYKTSVGDPPELRPEGPKTGRLDHDQIGTALFRIALGHQRLEEYATAAELFAEAAEAELRGDEDGDVDHAEAGRTLYERAWCLEGQHAFHDAAEAYARAIEVESRGDKHGVVDPESLGGTMHARGRALTRLGEIERASRQYLRAASFRAQGDRFGVVDHEAVGSSLHMAALVLRRDGQNTKARPLFERALVECRRGDGHGRISHESVGRTLHEIGHCLYGESRVEEARHWYELAVVSKQKGDAQGRVDHESLGLAHEMVAACLHAERDFEGARKAFEAAVAAAEKGDPQGAVQRESIRNHSHRLGVTCALAGRHEAAREAFQRSIREGEALAAEDLEFDRRDLAATWIEMGGLELLAGREAEAYVAFDKTVEVCSGARADGYDDGGRWWALHGVGLSLLRARRLDEAAAWFERAADEAAAGGEHGAVDHERVSKSLHEGGWCLADQGRTSEALPLFQRALDASRAGDADGRVDAHSVGTTLHEIAWCLAEEERYDEARETYIEAAREKQRGRLDGTVDEDSLARTWNEIGWCHAEEGSQAEAREAYTRALACFERAAERGEHNSEGESIALRAIGRSLLTEGQAKAARPWFERAVAKFSFGDARGNVDHARVGFCLRSIADFYEEVGRLPRARGWYERAVESYEKAAAAGAPDVEGLKLSLRSVGDCLEGEGRYDEAKVWFERADSWGQGDSD